MLQQKIQRISILQRIRQGTSTCKKLFFSALLAGPLVSFPLKTQALPIPNNDKSGYKKDGPAQGPKVKKRTEAKSLQPEKCRFRDNVFEYRLSDRTLRRFDNLLKDDENAVEVSCNDSYAFILTDKSMIMVAGKGEEKKGGARINLSYTRKDMGEINKIGLVAWTHAEDRCYFLMKDNKIREVPVIIKGETIPVYEIPHDLREAKMVFHSGFLFFAPVEKRIVAMDVSGNPNYIRLDPKSSMKDSDFFFKGKRLFFGKKDKKELEIIVKGPKLTNIKLIKKR